MQTRVCRLYGQQDLRLESDNITAPGPDEVLLEIGRGGICGSDLHYYQHGGVGTIKVREPIIMGHEFAGTIAETGAEIRDLQVGDKVGINPSQPCGVCAYCREGLSQHCLDMRFIGSALRLPHEQGGFRELMVIKARQCVKSNERTTLAELACGEPLAVALHAAKVAPRLQGKKVLINGAGPIGALSTAVAKFHGAEELVVTDLSEQTLSVAKTLGADTIINLANNQSGLEEYFADKGYFDQVFECSGAQAAVENILGAVKPQGTIVQVGVAGEITFPLNMLVGKEVKWIGSHRFHDEYAEAIGMIGEKKIDVEPIITQVFPMDAIHTALEVAADRSQSVKVQLSFN